MEPAHIALRVLAASQIFLFFWVLLLSNNPKRVRLTGCVLLLAVITYFIEPLLIQHVAFTNHLFAGVFQSLIPALTLYFVWSIFEDGRPLPKPIWGLMIIDVGLSMWVAASSFSNPILAGVSQLLKLGLAVLAVGVVWQGRDNDLVEMRAKVRMWFVGAFVTTVLAVALKEFFYLFHTAEPRLLGLAWMFVLSLVGNIAFFKMNPGMRLVEEVSVAPIDSNLSDPLVEQLTHRMKEERLYADHDLRVSTLASLMGLPEYQLRRKINQTLGFRNFNQFVNQYRISEAGERLLSEPRTPVLTIALDVGFRSISSFNTAFDRQFGVSPTVYRAQRLSDS